jgi:membrane peptidoglycan carboxypeptidase
LPTAENPEQALRLNYLNQIKRISGIFWNALRAFVRRRPGTAFVLAVLGLLWLICLPRPLFNEPLSVVVEDRNGELLGARIAADGQWRFPEVDSLPEKYAACVVTFEDRRFYWHPGVDPVSLVRALWQNLTGGRVVSGGSTLTMQVIRMVRGNPGRTVPEKLIRDIHGHPPGTHPFQRKYSCAVRLPTRRSGATSWV